MPRAKQVLVLSRAGDRRSYGEERLRASLPSRFLAEIPGDFIEAALGSQAEPGESRRYEPDPDYVASYSYRQKTRTPYGSGGGDGRGVKPVTRGSSKDPLVGAGGGH